MKEMKDYISHLSKDMQEKFLACATTEDAFRLAREEGLELTDEALDAVYGGCDTYTYVTVYFNKCKRCGTKVQRMSLGHDGFPSVYYCPTCVTTKDPDEVQPDQETVKQRK